MKRLYLSLALAAAVLAGGIAPAGAATAEQHCVVRVLERKPSGELVTGAPTCYDSYSQARKAAQAPASTKQAGASSSASSFVLATHYDGPNHSGSSTTVSGADCNGGWLNTSAQWASSMESTLNGCNKVVHYAGQNLTGTSQATWAPSGGNLNSSLYHHAWSIQYAT